MQEVHHHFNKPVEDIQMASVQPGRARHIPRDRGEDQSQEQLISVQLLIKVRLIKTPDDKPRYINLNQDPHLRSENPRVWVDGSVP